MAEIDIGLLQRRIEIERALECLLGLGNAAKQLERRAAIVVAARVVRVEQDGSIQRRERLDVPSCIAVQET